MLLKPYHDGTISISVSFLCLFSLSFYLCFFLCLFPLSFSFVLFSLPSLYSGACFLLLFPLRFRFCFRFRFLFYFRFCSVSLSVMFSVLLCFAFCYAFGFALFCFSALSHFSFLPLCSVLPFPFLPLWLWFPLLPVCFFHFVSPLSGRLVSLPCFSSSLRRIRLFPVIIASRADIVNHF